MKTCPKCAEKNEDWMNVCHVCGADISGVFKSDYEEELKKEKESDPYYIEETKKSNPYIDLIILIAVLSVILIFLILMLL